MFDELVVVKICNARGIELWKIAEFVHCYLHCQVRIKSNFFTLNKNFISEMI